MIRIIDISDLHINCNARKDKDCLARLQAIQKQFPTHWILGTGDITDDGHEKQYTKVYEALSPFKGRILLSPGNHDYGLLGNCYDKNCVSRFQGLQQMLGSNVNRYKTPMIATIQDQDVSLVVLGLDSNLRTTSIHDFACGKLGAWQRWVLRWWLLRPKLQHTLPDGRQVRKLVLLHHHPFYRGFGVRLHDSEALMRDLEGKIDVLCFGHRHKAKSWHHKRGIEWILAADSLRESERIWEIVVEPHQIWVNEVKL